MKAQEGDTVRVIDHVNGHKFEMNEEVIVMRVKENKGAYKCSNDEESWWLSAEEFELL